MKELLEYYKGHLDFKSACKLIDKTEEEITEQLNELKSWFKKQKHLPHNAIDESMMLKFLLGTKGNDDEAKCRLDSYFAVRNFAPALFADRDPQGAKILAANDFMYTGILPGLTPDGSRVVLFLVKDDDSAKMDLQELLIRTFCVIDVWLKTDPYASNLYIITDSSRTKASHLLYISIMRLREAVFCFQNVYPIRIRGILFINAPSFVKTFTNSMIKPFVKKKLANRFQVYSDDHSDLYNKIPLSMLPSDYGGDGPSMDSLNQTWINAVNKHRDWLMGPGSERSNEEEREGKSPVRQSNCVVM